MSLEMSGKKRFFNGKYKELFEKYSREEITHFQSLPVLKKDEILEIEKEINNYKSFKEPLRFKFLSLNTNIQNKIVILRKYEELMKLNGFSSEFSKLSKWINTVSQIPLGVYKEINYKNKPISKFLGEIKEGLDKTIYGHNEQKSNY